MNLSSHDYGVLKSYTFVEDAGPLPRDVITNERTRFNRLNNSKLLAVDVTKGELCEIEAKDVTIFNLFLALFNLGNLKGKAVSLTAICAHLEKYEWKVLKDKDGEDGKVFATVSELAYKNLSYKKNDKLLSKVAERANFLLWEGLELSYYENKHLKARCFREMLIRDFLTQDPVGKIHMFDLVLKQNKTNEASVEIVSNTPIYPLKERIATGHVISTSYCRAY